MICFSAKRQSAAFLDRRLRASEHSRIADHLLHCDSCSSHFDQLRLLRSGLLSLPAPKAPRSLRSRLKVVASRERQSLVQTRAARLEYLWNAWKFRTELLMRPFTIPATGGLLSSIVLFGVLALTIGSTTPGVGYEVPVLYAEQGNANLLPVDARSAVTLTMSLDDKGNIRDYAIHDDAGSYAGDSSRLTRHNISVPAFPGIMTMTQPRSSDIRISLTPIVFRPVL